MSEGDRRRRQQVENGEGWSDEDEDRDRVRARFWLFDCLVASVWHDGHEAGEFDCFGYPSLVFVAELISSACGNLKLGSDILP